MTVFEDIVHYKIDDHFKISVGQSIDLTGINGFLYNTIFFYDTASAPFFPCATDLTKESSSLNTPTDFSLKNI